MPGPSDVSDLLTAHEFLLGRINYERTIHMPYSEAEFKLDRMRRLLELVGDPHLALKAIHIAGTKGKGSTAAMVAAILTSAGLSTGLYTSPHLERVEERMTVDGQLCPEGEFVQLAADVQTAVGRLEAELPLSDRATGGPTFFEVTTVMAMLHFARRNVDAAVLEVGLGGRLDSTNVCLPEVCIITSISFDHMRQLGSTLTEIAGEKAGIIKAGVPVVSGVLSEDPRQVITNRAAAVGAPLFQLGVDYDYARRFDEQRQLALLNGQPRHDFCPHDEVFDYREPAADPAVVMDGLCLAMRGAHQSANGATAIAAIERLRTRGWAIDERAIRQGLATARCAARIEVVAEQPTVILDVAHNPASVAALVEVLREQYRGGRHLLVFASSKDKDYAGMLRLLVPEFDEVVLTQYIHNPRAVEAEALHAVVDSLGDTMPDRRRPHARLHVMLDPAAAWQRACELAGATDLICITGSFFLAAELRPVLALYKVEGSAGRTAASP